MAVGYAFVTNREREVILKLLGNMPSNLSDEQWGRFQFETERQGYSGILYKGTIEGVGEYPYSNTEQITKKVEVLRSFARENDGSGLFDSRKLEARLAELD